MSNMIKPQKFASEQDYQDQLFELILKYEGKKTYLHIGPKGVPAIGPGVELIIQNKGYNPRGRGKIDELLTAAHGRPTKLSDADWRRMVDSAAMLNEAADLRKIIKSNDKSPEVKNKELKAIDAKLRVDMADLIKGNTVPPFDATGLSPLYDLVAPDAERGIKADIRNAVKKHNADTNNKTKIDPDVAVAALANSHEILSLISL